MIYKIILLSDEVEDFKRVITIDSEATFLDLHKAIVESVEYSDDQPVSFFICDDDWTRLTEITLVEMDTSSEEDSYVMSETLLRDGLEEEKQKFMYVFEYLTERAFYLELHEIIPGKNQEKAICIKSTGEAPPQFTSLDDLEQSIATGTPDPGLEEDFYGDQEYDIDEIDQEGFEGFEGFEGTGSNPYDDTF